MKRIFPLILALAVSLAFGMMLRTTTTFAQGNLVLTGKVTLKDQSSNHIAIASADDKLFIAWAGVNDLHNINVAYSLDGYEFPQRYQITLDESSGAAPCLTNYKGELVLLWNNGGTHKIEVMHSPQTTDRRKYTLQNNETNATVTGFQFKDYLAIVWKGEDRDTRPNVLLSPDGKSFPESAKFVLGGDSSRYHIGGTQFKDMMILAFTGVDHEQRINVRYTNNNGGSWQSGPRMDNFSKSGPDLLVHKDRVIMAFVGTNGKLNVMYSLDGLNYSYKTTFNSEESAHAPQLAVFNGEVYMTWRGIDASINVAKIEGL